MARLALALGSAALALASSEETGASCVWSHDCLGGLTCFTSPSGGVCFPDEGHLKGQGEYCRSSRECDSSLACASGAFSGECQARQEGRVGLGEGCVKRGLLQTGPRCMGDLVCVTGAAYDICDLPGKLPGKACSDTSDCQLGLVCGAGPAYDICQRHDPNGKQSGEFCEHTYECDYGLLCGQGPAYPVCQETDPNGHGGLP